MSDDETTPEPEDEPEAEPEAEPDENEEADEDEREAAEPPPVALTEKQIESMFKKLEAEDERHRKRVRDLTGPMFDDLAPCPVCTNEQAVSGFYAPTLPEPGNTIRLHAVTQALGGESPAQYLPAPHREKCETCDGWGKVASGSRDPVHATVPCPMCGGTGHHEKPGATNVHPLPLPVAASPLEQALATGAPLPPDAWQRPPGHPHYGIPPATVGV